MKNFYEAYGKDEKLAQLMREIGWSRNIAILEKCQTDQEREFYIRSCCKHGWTMSSQTNFGTAIDPAVSVHAQLAVKDEHTVAFLDLEDAHSERELERAIKGRVEGFPTGDG